MVARGVTQAAVAEMLSVDVKTLRKHYAQELVNGYDIARDALDAKMWALALGSAAEYDAKGKCTRAEIKPTLGAATWLEKTRFGVTEFAPPLMPGVEKEETLGKKEARMVAAKHAGENTTWNDLINN